MMRYIKFFDQLKLTDINTVGGKNASLGQMLSDMQVLGLKVPFGFATTAEAYWLLINQNNLKDKISEKLSGLDISDIDNLQERGKQVRELILNATFPKELEEEIKQAYKILSEKYSSSNIDVAVRSSGTAEDLPDASFAGQQETFLNVKTQEELIESVKRCFASLFTNRAISYRQSRGFDHMKVALSVGVQKMVRSDQGISGIMFTIDTESANDKLILINSIYGIGENIVSGRVTPDEFLVFKPMQKKGYKTILRRKIGNKTLKMVYDEKARTKNIECSKEEINSFSLSEEDVIKLAGYGLKIEEYYSKLADEYRPMDIEWAKDGIDGEIYIVQARPETVVSKELKKQKENLFIKYRLISTVSKNDILVSGTAVGEKIGKGAAHFISDLKYADEFKKGEVLVASTTDPDWEPLMKKASAVVTDKGGRTCHAAIVAREIGVPTVVGAQNATQILKDGTDITVDCTSSDEGKVYKGLLEFEEQKIELEKLEDTKTKIFVNVGNPNKAFETALLPSRGVGLARMEFIINNYIKAHPMALVEMSKGNRVEDEEEIVKFLKGYDDSKKFFIDKLCEGIGTIAAAFYPRPVIVRTSDFKSNEYKNMPGGAPFEKDEENPMIGFRGASRYYSKDYKEAFIWECEALKKVREEMGLENVKVMLPFVRTPDEGRKVIEIMKEAGLEQGKNSLEIYAMCEIPSNVIYADEFLKVFDGYSIGSNDLTQLMLGVDRNSELISHIFDERNEAVKRMFKMAIDACKQRGKYIGICGQAPSDYPEITKFLVENEIESISLNPDSLLKMQEIVSKLEKELES
ncbi:phosphoenolpyruvate synthase [Halarcobacter anaerophilus]|nr:phosphoenolpyruvate synthase [Halarcobacter anaerophilus]